MIYPYISHYFYDCLVMLMTLLVGRQIFNIRLTTRQVVFFVLFMMTIYQLNFMFFIPKFGKSIQYVTLYMGLLISYKYIIKMNTIASLIVITTSTAINGIWTNINLHFMLTFLFANYGMALESKHVQYTSYVIVLVILDLILLGFKVRILDLEKYS